MAMTELGLGLSAARREEDALTVGEAELAMLRRLRASEESILVVQNNLANSYQKLGRLEMVLPLRQEVYSGRLRIDGDENEKTLRAAYNYAASLLEAKRIAEAKTLLREVIPVARRVLGEGNRLALKMRSLYAKALYNDPGATLDDLREAATTLEDTERIARRVLGSAHPLFGLIERDLQKARAALRAREDAEPDVSAQELDTAEAAAAAAVAAAAIKKRQRQDTIERERSRRRTG
jgi:hypothetical protein